MKIYLTLPQKIALGFMILLVIYWTSLFLTDTKEGFHNFFYSFLFGLTPLIGGLIATFNAKVWGGLKTSLGKALFFIGFGMFLWGSGEMVWSYYNFFVGEPAPYPSVADVGFAPSIFFYGLGALFLSRITGAKLGLKSKLAKFFVAITPIIILPIAWYILVTIARGGVLVPEGETFLKIVLDIAYPLGSFVALTVAIILSGLSFKYMGGRYSFSVWSILAGLFVMFIGDTSFSYETTLGTFYNANYGDLLLTTGTFLLTFGALGFYRYKEPIQKFVGESGQDLFDNVALKIIKDQEILIGPVAWYEAEKVTGLNISQGQEGRVYIDDTVDPSVVIDNLIERYVKLFGPAAKEASKNASKTLVADLEYSRIPVNLR